ncbi:MAG: hypothetical protein P8X82_10905 [Gemmatimonadales bacterium]|jgi:hypothetical protein
MTDVRRVRDSGPEQLSRVVRFSELGVAAWIKWDDDVVAEARIVLGKEIPSMSMIGWDHFTTPRLGTPLLALTLP